MSYNTPPQIAAAAVASGTAKAQLSPPKALVGGFLAGAYIAFGGLLAIVASSGLDPKTWGGLITLVTGVVFSLGLVLVIIGGAELLTGNMALVPMAVLSRKVTVATMLINWLWVTIGNFAGSLFVAYVLADKTGVIKQGAPGSAGASWTRLAAIVTGKATTETHMEQFLRAVGCNWLVCLAVWLAIAATTVGGKILAIVFPITAFVALGFDHVVANMFFLPLGLFEDTGISGAHVAENLIFAFLGNAVGAGVFVAGAYWYLYAKDAPADGASTTAAEPEIGDGQYSVGDPGRPDPAAHMAGSELPAVRLHIAGADFYLLPVENSRADAQRLAEAIEGLREESGGALRLRPRTAPPHAPWVRADSAATHLPDATRTPLTGHEDPGTSWRDVRGAEIGEVEVVALGGPVALWHWAVGEGGVG